ncbi:hypothetical protein IWQ62_001254 [Dispira parvispora]|uniref:Uncharacterized protein n=1 Tax=Dispira parvispora TaxID=1520584 RepID=A0A9W8AYB2_9FUNG|nr:hypothetical protein IWQ62_001254 [Dispira parvispora]
MSGFWQSVKKYLVVNADVPSSMFNPGTYRKPSPGSQPKYIPKVTEQSDISNNYYYQRDVRRNYPRVAMFNQADVVAMLTMPEKPALDAPIQEKVQQADKGDSKTQEVTATSKSANLPSLPEAVRSLEKPMFSESQLPPLPGKAYKYTVSESPVHPDEPGVYFPVYNVQ